MRAPTFFRRQQGMTVVELAIGVAVVALVLRLALPSFESFLASVVLNAGSQDLLGDLHLARSEALARNRRVTVCKSANGIQCASSGDWEQGWVVFEDADHSGTLEPGEPVIARRPALAAGLRLTGNATVASYVSYTGQGMSRLANGGFQAGTLTLCRQSASAGDARQVIVNAVGRPRLQKSAVAACD